MVCLKRKMNYALSKPGLKTISLPWLSLTLFVILSIAFLLPIQPNDYWWYVRLGQEISQNKVIPTVDSFSYTQAGQPIVYHSWLSALLFWVLHVRGGTLLTVLVRGILLVSFYIFIWQTVRLAGSGPRLVSALTLLAALAGSHNWAMRPQLFALPLFGLALLILWRWQQGEGRHIWLLPLITVLWVNLHGSYVLIFLLAGPAFVGGGGDRRTLLKVMLAMVLASFLNPRGLGSWSYVLTLLTDPPSQYLGAEWHPPTNQSWQGALFFAWFLLLVPLASFSPSRPTRTQWLWLLGFGWMALSGLRYVIWFLAILAPVSAYLLAPLVGGHTDRSHRSYPAVDIMFATVFLLLPLALLPGIRERWWAKAPPVLSPNTPVEAVRWLKTQPDLPGPLWSDLAFSSYLIYVLPERPVWIDTRFELFPLEHWQRYIMISEAGPGWQDLLAEDGVHLLMIDPQMQPRLLQALRSSPEWLERYQDETTIIFTR